MTVKCIDISHHQGTPDFDRVAADGVVAMIHKATQGTGNVDQCRAENIVNAMAAGIACCTYHFLEHGNIEAQIAHYLATVDPVQGERVVIDWEDWPGGGSYVTAADLVAAVELLIEDERGLQVAVYGSESKLLEELTELDELDAAVLRQTDLWIAHYGVDEPGNWPRDIWPTWSLFQYSDQGSVEGISTGSVDLNRFNGTDENLVKWIMPAGESGEPIERAAVVVAIETQGDVDISIVVNGEVVARSSAAR